MPAYRRVARVVTRCGAAVCVLLAVTGRLAVGNESLAPAPVASPSACPSDGHLAVQRATYPNHIEISEESAEAFRRVKPSALYAIVVVYTYLDGRITLMGVGERPEFDEGMRAALRAYGAKIALSPIIAGCAALGARWTMIFSVPDGYVRFIPITMESTPV